MEKNREMMDRVLDKLEEVLDEKNFQRTILSVLKNDYECEQLLRLIDEYDVRTPDNVLILTILIGEARDKAQWKGEYLKDIDDDFENAMLDEDTYDYDDYDDDDEEDYDEEDEDYEEEDDEDNAEKAFLKRIYSLDFRQTVEDARNGETKAKWNLVNYIAVTNAEAYSDEYDIDKLYYDTLCDLAEAKETASYIMLGDAVLHGKGCEQNTEEAIHWYEKAAENGERFGNECIGQIYYFGKYIGQDYKKAYEYFIKDEDKKSYCTLYFLGEMYRQGLYVEKDLTQAYEYYKEIVYDDEEEMKISIDEYYWRACYRVAHANHYGEGTEKHIGRALEVLCEAMLSYKENKDDASDDITWDEMKREWIGLNKDAGWF